VLTGLRFEPIDCVDEEAAVRGEFLLTPKGLGTSRLRPIVYRGCVVATAVPSLGIGSQRIDMTDQDAKRFIGSDPNGSVPVARV